MIKSSQQIRICFDCVISAKQSLTDDELFEAEQTERKLLKPKQIKAYLDEHIIGQDIAKKALSVAVYNHYKRLDDIAILEELNQVAPQLDAETRVFLAKRFEDEGLPDLDEELESRVVEPTDELLSGDELDGDVEAQEAHEPLDQRALLRQEALNNPVRLSKGNILMVGPTGVGKTALAERIAELLDVPFVVKDATTLTAAGYVGEDVESIIKTLWESADRDVERTARGIVVIDEIDKIARRGASSQSGRDVGGESVQQSLLKLIEGTQVNIQPEGGRMPRSEPIQVDTTHILFILCGAFVGLDKLIQRRMSPGSIGFGVKAETERERRLGARDPSYNDVIPELQTEDLLKYGMIPEFMGRLPVVVYLEDLDEDALVEILWKPKTSIVKQYQHLFSLNDVELEFTEAAMREVVRKAMKRKSGARGLRSVIEGMMLDLMYELPDRAELARVIIDEDFVRGEVDEPRFEERVESA
jgi:ATP-dependent Clp protease ATP-binding subunit ClpX